MDVESFNSLKTLKDKFYQLTLTIPRKYAMITQSVNVTGNDISKAKNCKNCFSVSLDMEDCKYLWLFDRTKDSCDVQWDICWSAAMKD